MILASALRNLGGRRTRLLVTPHPTDPDRVIDLHGTEVLRLAKLGEGLPRRVAEALVPHALLPLLQGGARALHRVRQAYAYALKWQARHGLPEALAPKVDDLRLEPCLPRPMVLRHYDGQRLETHLLGGPGATLSAAPVPTLAMVGMAPGRLAGYCLATEDGPSAVLGAWLSLGSLPEGALSLHGQGAALSFELAFWGDLPVPTLQAGEVVLLPPPRFPLLPPSGPGRRYLLTCPFETLELTLGSSVGHPTVQ